MFNSESVISDAKKVFDIEINELKRVRKTIDLNFAYAVQALNDTKGKVIVVGMGKSGIIGRKIAASFASTGTPSFFVHPAEAFHGDLGMIQKEDTVVLLSNSGETDELLKSLSFFKFNENITISITSNKMSTLAINSNFHILCEVLNEACPLDLAPTSSTTAALVIGDAITAALINLKGFKPENFARYHPRGSLGKKLLTEVKDVMIYKNLPLISENENIKSIIHKISSSGYGAAIQVSRTNVLEGIITDGDIRRAMECHERSFFELKAKNISTKEPLTTSITEKISAVEQRLANSKIRTLVVVDNDNVVVGMLFI